jgi:cysteinyl-tRNA synthetase
VNRLCVTSQSFIEEPGVIGRIGDLLALNVWEPTVRCRATEHIPEMIALVERLMEMGYGYLAGGNVYFSVDRFPTYGELAQLQLDQLQAGRASRSTNTSATRSISCCGSPSRSSQTS